jgi:hypothetical protein
MSRGLLSFIQPPVVYQPLLILGDTIQLARGEKYSSERLDGIGDHGYFPHWS